MILQADLKPDIWLFYDLDQTVIDTYKGADGQPYIDRRGKPFFTREVWSDVLYKEGVIDQRDFVYLGEPWLKLARGEYTNEQAAVESNKRYLEVMKGKRRPDLVEVSKTKLAPRVVLKPFINWVHEYFSRHANSIYVPVTNVYDEVCQGYNDAGVIIHQARICNKPRLVDGCISDSYEMDVSVDKQRHVAAFIKERKIPRNRIFGFIDRYPQDAWGCECGYLYGVGNDGDTKTFVKIYNGTMVREDRHIKHLLRSIGRDMMKIKEEKS